MIKAKLVKLFLLVGTGSLALGISYAYNYPYLVPTIDKKIEGYLKKQKSIKDKVKRLANLKSKIKQKKQQLQDRILNNTSKKYQLQKQIKILEDLEKLLLIKQLTHSLWDQFTNQKDKTHQKKLFTKEEVKWVLFNFQKNKLAPASSILSKYIQSLINQDWAFYIPENKIQIAMSLMMVPTTQYSTSIEIKDAYTNYYEDSQQIRWKMQILSHIKIDWNTEDKWQPNLSWDIKIKLDWEIISKPSMTFLKLKDYQLDATWSFKEGTLQWLKDMLENIKDYSQKYEYIALKPQSQSDIDIYNLQKDLLKKLSKSAKHLSQLDKKLLMIPYKKINDNTWLLIPSKYLCDLSHLLDLGTACDNEEYQKAIKTYISADKKVYISRLDQNNYKLYLTSKDKEEFEVFITKTGKIIRLRFNNNQNLFKYDDITKKLKANLSIPENNLSIKIDTQNGNYIWQIRISEISWKVFGKLGKYIGVKGSITVDWNTKVNYTATWDFNKEKLEIVVKNIYENLNLYLGISKQDLIVAVRGIAKPYKVQWYIQYTLSNKKIKGSFLTEDETSTMANINLNGLLREKKWYLSLNWYINSLPNLDFGEDKVRINVSYKYQNTKRWKYIYQNGTWEIKLWPILKASLKYNTTLQKLSPVPIKEITTYKLFTSEDLFQQ